MYDNKVRYDKTKTERSEWDKANSKKRVQEKAKETDIQTRKLTCSHSEISQ